jgi:DNA-directed RNA polymerase subunit RPC12/RpoP
VNKLNVLGNGPCLACGRQMRPCNRPIADNPGTIAHHSKGVCVSCTKRRQRGIDSTEYKPKIQAENCIDCDRQLRPRRARAADYPGTVEHRGEGRCQTCGIRRAKAMRPQAPKPAPKPAAEVITGVDPAMDAYMRKRRERKARQERIAQIRRRAA